MSWIENLCSFFRLRKKRINKTPETCHWYKDQTYWDACHDWRDGSGSCADCKQWKPSNDYKEQKINFDVPKDITEHDWDQFSKLIKMACQQMGK